MMDRDMVVTLAKAIARNKRHVCLVGPPGVGKTGIAREVMQHVGPPSALHAKHIGQIRRAAGLERLPELERPFRAPHHTVSLAGMIGRRPDPVSAFPCYGELSLAHGGVLLLDELPEFTKSVLESVLSALEEKRVLGMSSGTVSYPAEFQLIAAMNPCPCGYRGHPTRTCECSDDAVARYRARVEPILKVTGEIDLLPLSQTGAVWDGELTRSV